MLKQYDFSTGKRGAIVQATASKTRITIRIDSDVLDWFRSQVDDAGGGNYQTLINEALRSFMTQEQESLETVVRRVVREELKKASPQNLARPQKQHNKPLLLTWGLRA